MPATAENKAAATTRDTGQQPGDASLSLWGQPIPIIGLTGEYASGKTLFSLTIDPEHTLVYDTEKSSETYSALGFRRVDVAREMLKNHASGYKPIDTFTWWLDSVRSITPGKFRVIVLDTASEIESGAVDWVRANPSHFGRTMAQYLKMEGLLWGDMKELWKSILNDLASRCETFVFTVHLGTIWADNKPTGKKKPKGKSTLMELASLYMHMERKAGKDGAVPAVPAAVVLKSRLAHTRLTASGIQIVPALPPRLPRATPQAIREYIRTPPDYTKLTDDEKAPEQTLSDDDRAAVKLATVEAEVQAESLKLEREERAAKAAEKRAAKDAARQQKAPPKAAAEPQVATVEAPADPAPATKSEPPADAAPPATGPESSAPAAAPMDPLGHLHSLKAEFFALRGVYDPAEIAKQWEPVLARRGAKQDKDLTVEQVAEIGRGLHGKIAAMLAEQGKGPPPDCPF